MRITAALMTVSGLGALSFFSSYAPGRWTRFGYAGPLFGDAARDFGLAVFVIGLLPLAFFARSARQAGWFAGCIVVLFWAAIFAWFASG
ncbi:hypothetical protein [Zeimonas arvi]|uniref:Uncharacterized protein n=1 Tax=Zeimonas arvi TaxID=2498847 RepID=A0A5C8P6H7_9BURK|nr:hypothetical protein [Zeimonas arvi]TXL68923.1 hypothetical protein FHP08_04405 [Zeimonas arvi]